MTPQPWEKGNVAKAKTRKAAGLNFYQILSSVIESMQNMVSVCLCNAHLCLVLVRAMSIYYLFFFVEKVTGGDRVT